MWPPDRDRVGAEDAAPTSADMQCPFYRDHRQTHITCEGLIPGTTITTNFRGRRDDWLLQLRVYCADIKGCQRCEVHMALYNYKYNDKNPV